MAYFDRAECRKIEESLKKYEELKKHITSKDKNGKLNDFVLSFEHIIYMEKKYEEQKKQIEEYKKFFSLMKNLLPRTTSINDIIG